MKEILKRLEGIEERLERLEIKLYGEKPSDILVCTFEDVISEPRERSILK